MHPARPESPRTANCQLLYFTTYSVTADGGTLAAITNAWSSHPEGASHITLVRSPMVLPDTLPAILLISDRTGSAGEALTMSFIGRSRTRIFGERSSGFATNNRMCFLSDSAILNITSGVMMDRTGGTHEEGIEPDRRFPREEDAFAEAMDSLLVMSRRSATVRQ